jgi:hypothetical protein
MAKKKLDMKFVKHAQRKEFYAYVREKGRDKFTLSHVYWYMYMRSGKGNVYHLADELAAGDLGMGVNVFRETRNILAKDGWVAKQPARRVPDWIIQTTQIVGTHKVGTHKESTHNVGTHKVGDAVVVHLQEALEPQNPNAYTSSCEPMAPTSSDVSFFPSVNQGTSVPVAESEEKDKTLRDFTPKERKGVETLTNAIGYRDDIPKMLGITYFHSGHDLNRIAVALWDRNRSASWFAQMVSWAKTPNPKDREATFWCRKIQTGDKAVVKLAEFLETGTIAEQYDAKIYARTGDAFSVVPGESNDLLARDGAYFAQYAGFCRTEIKEAE